MNRSNWRRLWLALLAPAVILGALEGTLRLTGVAPAPREMRFPGFELVPKDLASGLCPMQRHPTRFYQQVPNQVGPFASDEQAFRGGRHPSWHENLLRVAFIGDSCTMGFGCRYGESFVGVAESALRRRFPERDVDGVNAGCAGYSTYQNRLDLEERVLPLRPQIVVLAISAWNDTQGAVEIADEVWGERLSGMEQGVGRAVRRLHLGRMVERLISDAGSQPSSTTPLPERPRGERPNGARVPESQFRSNVTQMIERSRAAGSEVIVVLLTTTAASEQSDPEPKRYREIARGLAAERGVLILDAEPLFAVRDTTTFFDSIHPAEAGHRAIGLALAERVAETAAKLESPEGSPGAKPTITALEPAKGFAFGDLDLVVHGSGFESAHDLRWFLGGEPLELVRVESDARIRLRTGPLPPGPLTLESVCTTGSTVREGAFDALAPELSTSVTDGNAKVRVTGRPGDHVTLYLATERGESLKLFGRRFGLKVGTLLPQTFEGAVPDGGEWVLSVPLRSSPDAPTRTFFLQAIVEPTAGRPPHVALYTEVVEIHA